MPPITGASFSPALTEGSTPRPPGILVPNDLSCNCLGISGNAWD